MTGLSISLIKVKAFRTRHKMQRIGRRLLRDAGNPEPTPRGCVAVRHAHEQTALTHRQN
jgi:hypothetical protein